MTPPTVFVVFADPPPEREAEFNEWYDTVHGPDALENGSFTAMHRYVAVDRGLAPAPYLALWEGRFGNEAEAWAYIGPRAQALRDAGRVSDVTFVRFAVMLFAAGGTGWLDPTDTVSTIQNDWRSPTVAFDEWHGGAEGPHWSATGDAAGKGGGLHLVVAADTGLPENGASPLPPYETIFGDAAGSSDDRAPAERWVQRWAPVTSMRA